VSDFKIFDRAAPNRQVPSDQPSESFSPRVAADAQRGIAVASGAHSHGTYVIQVRRQPETPAPSSAWVEENEDDQVEDVAVQTVNRTT
jgi:hypothetical protein